MARKPESTASTFVPEASTAKKDPKAAALEDNWEKRVEEDGTEQWINRGDFKIPGGAVPGGVIRSIDEACALEAQRCG